MLLWMLSVDVVGSTFRIWFRYVPITHGQFIVDAVDVVVVLLLLLLWPWMWLGDVVIDVVG